MADDSSRLKRTVQACEQCRRRKRKCDGLRPICSLCSQQNKECMYEVEDGIRKRKFTSDHEGQLQEQIAALKSYIHDLERAIPTREAPDVIADLRKRYFSVDEEDDGRRDRGQLDADGPGPHRDDQRLSSAVDEIGSLFWSMSVGDTGDKSFIGPSGNFCFPSSYPALSPKSVQHLDQIYVTPEIHLLDNTLILELSELFMEHINPPHQFVGSFVPTFDSTYSTSMDNQSLLQAAILAAGSCFSNRSDASAIGRAFSSHAEKIALKCCRQQPSFEVVQALTILCWRELGLEHDNMAWMYNSMAASVVTHLGLHADALETLRNPESFTTTTPEEQKARLRTFWQFFLMDRIATSLLGRQCTLPWRRVRASPFFTVLPSNATVKELAFDSQCQLWLLHDRYMDQIYSFEFASLDFNQRNKLLMDARGALTTFYGEMDSRLRLGKELGFRGLVYLQMSYQMSLLLIHRPYLREKPESGSYNLALRAMTAAATSMTRLIHTYRRAAKFHQAPFYVVHHILTAAIMHLLSATSSRATLRQQSVVRFRTCVEALEEMRHTWPRATKSIRLLQEMASRWKVVFALPMHLSFPIGVENVTESSKSKILLDQPILPDRNVSDHSTCFCSNLQPGNDHIRQGRDQELNSTSHEIFLDSQFLDTTLPVIEEFDDMWSAGISSGDLNFGNDPLGDAGLEWLFAVSSEQTFEPLNF